MTEKIQFALNSFSEHGENNVLFSGYSQTFPYHKVGPQVHDYFLLHVVLRGKGSFHCAGKTYSLSAGDSFFIYPKELVTYESDRTDPWYYTWVAFQGPFFEETLRSACIQPESPIVSLGGKGSMIKQLFYDLYSSMTELKVASSLKTNAYLRLIISEFIEQTTILDEHSQKEDHQLDQHIQDVIRLLSLRYFEPLSIETIAASYGYNRTYFSKKFKEYTGYSPSKYLLNIRMKKAEALLQKSLTIQEVASSVGYRDPLYFSKQFKQWSGVAPSVFRQQHLKESEPKQG
ncbi:AraC family transcriptional regulator [Halalkalibacterium halodurans]|uniref:AraC family transcriptional regulator n=1 Tax=Halalkalibacterium halodurans TaxID=86665 RepID=UPI002E2407CE|nr:AraC family transcriptional regulator [Halalkalibacterium halodurans]